MENFKTASPLLQNNEERLTSLLQSVPDLLFLFKPDGTITGYYAANSESLFLPTDRIIGANIKDIPIKQENIDEVFSAAKRTLETGELECIYYSSTAGEKELHFEACIIAHNENELFAMIKEVTDIIEAEKSFYKYIGGYEKGTGRPLEALIVTDEKGLVFFWSNRATKIFKIVKDKAVGENIKNLINSIEFSKKIDNFIKNLGETQSQNASPIEFQLKLEKDFKPILFKLNQLKIGAKHQLLISANYVENK
ncbi:MAG: PAS domain-containing protein [Ignavibacteria bacterium]|nr:PAS domain-containing protein [Ignavibacteria bacterium]